IMSSIFFAEIKICFCMKGKNLFLYAVILSLIAGCSCYLAGAFAVQKSYLIQIMKFAIRQEFRPQCMIFAMFHCFPVTQLFIINNFFTEYYCGMRKRTGIERIYFQVFIIWQIRKYFIAAYQLHVASAYHVILLLF